MNLLIDMGNSRLKSAQLIGGRLVSFESMSYDGRPPIDCLKSVINGKSEIDAITLVSVLGDAFKSELLDFCEAKKIFLTWAASTAQAHGVINSYHQPSRLGSDRFVALVGARKLFPKQYCIVVDCGTAVTVDALDAQGVFLGGVIMPGLQLWGDSLTGRASQLNAHELEQPDVFARDTPQAIGSGSVYGLVGAVEGVCQRMASQFEAQAGVEVPVIKVLCGGDAELIAAHTSVKFEVLPQLVLTGLAEFTNS